MKRKTTLLAGIIGLAFIFSACTARYVKQGSPESTIEIKGYSIKKFNGDYKGDVFQSLLGTRTYVIPAGTHTLTLKRDNSSGTNLEALGNALIDYKITYNFKANGKYTIQEKAILFSNLQKGDRVNGFVINKVK